MKYKIMMVSLGCSENRVDAEEMLGVLANQGHEIVSDAEKADIIIVNTCGFTESAKKVVEFVQSQNFVSEQTQKESTEDKITETDKKIVEAANTDELLSEAIAFAVEKRNVSVSMLQRRFRVGYGRACNLMDKMEKRGVVGPHIGSKPREVLITKEEYDLGFTPEDKNADY